jgi:4-amino-4-deoxy-L-arabinose transferase-like glycosyltransferase
VSRPAAQRGLLLIAIAAALLRVIFGGLIHLTEDEAYYRLWAQHLQFGYYDHPPMIAWWIRAGMTLAGDSALGVRLLPALATGVTTWLVGDLARRLGGDDATAARAGLWYNATLTLAVGGILAIPDAPASLFWTLTLWCLVRTTGPRAFGWWLAAGAAAGCSLLSKYSGLFLAPGVLLWVLGRRDGRAALATPGPWLAALLALAIFSPNLIWNAGHGWASFMRQYGRVAPHSWHVAFLLEFLATQVLLLNPIIAVYAARGVSDGLGGRSNLWLPIATSAPFALYLLIHSLHDRVQGHWPAPLFSALVICGAVAASRRPSWVTKTMAPGLGLGLAALVLVYLALPFDGFGKADPSTQIRGWPVFAHDVERLRQANGAAWVGTDSYGVLGQLDAVHAVRAPLIELIERDRYRKAGPQPDWSRPGLAIDLERRLKPENLAQCFSQVRPLGTLVRAGDVSKNSRYVAFLVAGRRLDVWNDGCPD